MGNHDNKGRQLRLALRICKELPVAAERLLVTLVKRAEWAQIAFLLLLPANFNSFCIYGNHMDRNFCMETQRKVDPRSRFFLVLGSFPLHVKSP